MLHEIDDTYRTVYHSQDHKIAAINVELKNANVYVVSKRDEPHLYNFTARDVLPVA